MANLHSQLLLLLILVASLFLAIIQPSLAHSRKLILQSPQKAADTHHFGSLNEVRLYLERFGYKEKRLDNNLIQDTLTTESSLYAAISLYQQKNHLNVTGKLDPETVVRMMTPRCGMPDIFPSGRKGGSAAAGHQHHHGTSRHGKLLHVVGHYKLFDNMSPWTRSEITYNFTSTVLLVSLEDLRAICGRAFQRWAAVTRFQFREAGEGEQADITIGFYTGDHGDGFPFDGPGHVWAHAFAPQDGRLHFDGSELWSTATPTMDETDLESVALHEIGHTLGLAHTTDQDAVMYAYIGRGVVKRELQQDDIDGIRALYPSK